MNKRLRLPEDSMLKRHYLTHLRSLIEAEAGPRPTDSVLRRHYDGLVAARLEECLEDESRARSLMEGHEACRRTATPAINVANPVLPEIRPTVHMPQDSMLRRHYTTHLASMIAELAGPRPTDSVLRRHYDSLVAARLGECLEDESRVQSLMKDYEAYRKAALAKPPSCKPRAFAAHVPQDSMLRRHYMAHLLSMITALAGPRPKDAALRRHYDTLIDGRLDVCLENGDVVEKLFCDYEALRQKRLQLRLLFAERR